MNEKKVGINTNNIMHLISIYDYVSEDRQKIIAQAILEERNYDNIILFAIFTHLTHDLMNKIVNIIIESKNPEYIYSLIKIPSFGIIKENIKKLSNVLVNTKNPKYIYKWAYDLNPRKQRHVKDGRIHISSINRFYNINISELTDTIIEINDSKYIYLFAKDIYDVDIEKLENAIINTQGTYYMYKFLDECRCVNPGKLISAIADIKINGIKQNENSKKQYSKNIIKKNHK